MGNLSTKIKSFTGYVQVVWRSTSKPQKFVPSKLLIQGCAHTNKIATSTTQQPLQFYFKFMQIKASHVLSWVSCVLNLGTSLLILPHFSKTGKFNTTKISCPGKRKRIGYCLLWYYRILTNSDYAWHLIKTYIYSRPGVYFCGNVRATRQN